MFDSGGSGRGWPRVSADCGGEQHNRRDRQWNKWDTVCYTYCVKQIFTFADMVWHLNFYLCFYRCDSQVYKRSLLQEVPWAGITRSHTTRVH